MPPAARISIASESEDGERDLRAASCPVSSSPKGVPYSSVLAERREIAAKLAAAKAGKSTSRGPKREHGWSSTSADDTASRGKSSVGSTSGRERRLSPRALMRKYRAKVKPRTYLYSVFGLIELFGIGIFCAAAAAGSRAVNGNYASRAQDGIGAVHEAFTKKTEQVMWCLQSNLGVSAAVHAYLATNGTGSATTTLDIFSLIQTLYQVEHFAVLGADKQIYAKLNSQAAVGEVFDPEGIVTAAQRANGLPVWTYSSLSYSDVLREAPPLFRDRASDVDQAEKGYHPYESKKDSVVRWMAIAIQHIDTNTWAAPAADAPIIGYIIVGDILNGKSLTTSAISLNLGGQAGVQTYYTTPTNSSAKGWITSSATISVALKAGVGTDTFTQNALVQGFNPYKGMPNRQSYLDSVAATARNSTAKGAYGMRLSRGATRVITPYTMATRNWAPDTEQPPTTRPPLLLSRGVLIDPTYTTTAVIYQTAGLGAIILLDCVTLLLATWLFLSPLEAMGKRIRGGQQVDIGYLRSLTKRRNYCIFVVLAGAASLAVAFWTRGFGGANMKKAVDARSAAVVGNMKLAYVQDIEGTSKICASLQPLSSIRALTVDSSNANNVKLVNLKLKTMADVLTTEFMVLLNATGQVVAAPNDPQKLLVGTQWNPGFVVSSTLATGKRYTRSGIVKHEELVRFNVTPYSDKYKESTPDSQLSTFNTHQDGLVRWTSTPIWATGAATGTTDVLPTGVLVTGEVLNSNTRIVERTNSMLGYGYSAIYMYNTTQQYQLIASVRRLSNNSFAVDDKLASTAFLDKLRTSKTWLLDDHETVTADQTIRDVRYIVSARCINKNAMYDLTGTEIDPIGYDGQPTTDCFGFLIQGLPWSKVKNVLAPGYTWQWIFVIACIVKLFALFYLCYKAYLPFHRIVVNNKFVQGALLEVGKSPRSAPSSPASSIPTAANGSKVSKAVSGTVSAANPSMTS